MRNPFIAGFWVRGENFFGRAAILHSDFPERVSADPAFEPIALPVSAGYLRDQGLGEPFIGYMRTWKGFVEA